MPTCAVMPSQIDESLPLSQRAMSEHSSQCSFGGGAPFITAAGAASRQSSQRQADGEDHIEACERQDDPDLDDSMPLLDIEEIVDKLSKMLRMRGKSISIQPDLLAIMETWLSDLCKNDADRQSQERSVQCVEDFIRSSAIKSSDDLLDIDVTSRQWWPASDGDLDNKKLAVLELLKNEQSKHSGSDAKKMETPAVSPSKLTQWVVNETPDGSFEADRPVLASMKSTGVPSSPKAAANDGAKSSNSSMISSQQPAEKAADTSGAARGPAVVSPLKPSSPEGAATSAGDKRRADDCEPESAFDVQQALALSSAAGAEGNVDDTIETHKKTAEQSYNVYHNLRAKRQRLLREVESAKLLEQAKRDLVKKLDKDKAEAAIEGERMLDAEKKLEEAQKLVLAVQKAKRARNAAVLACEAELKEVRREISECNDRLKMQSDQFHQLLAQNNVST